MSARTRLAALLPALRSPDCRRLFAGQVVSLVGDAIHPIALAALGFAVVGPIAAAAGTRPTMVVAGLVTMALFAAAATVPDVRRLRRRVAVAS